MGKEMRILTAMSVTFTTIMVVGVVVMRDYRHKVDSLMAALRQAYGLNESLLGTGRIALGGLQECRERTEKMGGAIAAMQKVGSVPYRNPGANCLDHSRALQKELAAANIESSIFVNEGRRHAWVCAWIEANTGQFIPLGHQYNPVLEARDRNLKVICE